MKIIITIAILLFLAPVLGEITITKPLLILVNSEGEEVATKSTSISKAMEKASALPPGVYTLKRPDVTITVKATAEPEEPENIPPVAVAGTDFEVEEGTIVYLPCDASYDPDGTIVKCEWKQTSGPEVEIRYTETGTAYYVMQKDKKIVDRS